MEAIDKAFAGTPIARFFEFEERGAKFSVELKGAIATFMTMAYVLAVNPRIIADSGGPCVPDEDGIFGEVYSTCIEEVRNCILHFFIFVASLAHFLTANSISFLFYSSNVNLSLPQPLPPWLEVS